MFREDLMVGKSGEAKAMMILKETYGDMYDFIDVSNSILERNKGDIAIRSKLTGDVRYIDIKNDRRIYDTGNVALELWYQFEGDMIRDGWITSKYDYLGVMVSFCNTLVILDFNKVKDIYWNGNKIYETKMVPNGESNSCIALVPIKDLEDAIIDVAGEYPEWIDQFVNV